MAARTIAVANMKGGVGKTTLVVFLAEALAAEDQDTKVLVVDADPQASASVALVGDAELKRLIEGGRTLDAFLEDNLVYPSRPIRTRLHKLLKKNVSSTTHLNVPLDVSLLSCGPYLRLVEKETVRNFTKQKLGPDAYEGRLWSIWKDELELLKAEYDYIIFDCAPSLSTINEIMVRSADLVLLPTIPDFISAYGLNSFLHSVWNYPIANLPKPTKPPYVVIARYQGNLNQHRASAEELVELASEKDAPFRVCRTFIANSVHFAEALAKADDCPTFTNKYSPRLINEVIAPLTDEIRRVLDAHAP